MPRDDYSPSPTRTTDRAGGGAAAAAMSPDGRRGNRSRQRQERGRNRSVTADLNMHMVQIAHDSKGDRKKLLAMAAKVFDKGLSVLVSKTKDHVTHTLNGLQQKLDTIEGSLRSVLVMNEEKNAAAMLAAKRTADHEREEKAMLCQWLNTFLIAAPIAPTLCSMDFTFARFALNMAMSASKTPPQVMIKAGVPTFLVSLLASPNELVTGPAIMALSQLSQHPACSRAVALSGGTEPIISLCDRSQSPAVLEQAATCVALLSLSTPNKPTIAAKGGVRSMVKVVAGYMTEDRCTIAAVAQALSALANVQYESDAIRNLTYECGVIPALCLVFEKADDDWAIEQACKVVANLSFGNGFTSSQLLKADVDRLLHDAVSLSSDMRSHSDIAAAGFIALANLSNNEMNQAQVGSGRALELCIHACEHCLAPPTVRRAAQALGALCFKSHANKTRAARAVPILVEVVARWGLGDDVDLMGSANADKEALGNTEGEAAAWALYALAILLLHPTNVLFMKDIDDGTERIVEVAASTEHNGVLTGASMVLVALLPEVDALLRARANEEPIHVEELGAADALMRCKDWAFGRGNPPPPPWLSYGIDLLTSSEDHLILRRNRNEQFRLPDFTLRNFFFQEVCTPVPPDVDLFDTDDDQGLGSMLFNIY